jgi:predicted SAM-dependent methyltransferase
MKIIRGELTAIKSLIRPFIVNKYLNAHPEPMLNLGSGPYRFPGWLTADAFASEADIYMNVKKAFPFKSSSFSVIYSEHMLEHIYIDKVPSVLKEIHRVLKPNGLFRVTVPDLEIHARNYVEKNSEFFKPIVDKYMARWDKQKNKYWLIRSNGGAFMTRAVQRFYHHRWMYDFDTLSSCLKETGFSVTTKQSFRQSFSEEAAKLDKEDRSFETLYIDARK